MSGLKNIASIRTARQCNPTLCRTLIHDWCGLAVDEMPRTILFAIHQVHHLGLVGLIIISYFPITPRGVGDGEATLAIASPVFTRTRTAVYTEADIVGYVPTWRTIIDAMESPTAFAAPSDDASYNGGVRRVSDNVAVVSGIVNIYICSLGMSNDTSGMGTR